MNREYLCVFSARKEYFRPKFTPESKLSLWKMLTVCAAFSVGASLFDRGGKICMMVIG
jgi:hypothetical protein